jgi:hypothetical protein
VGVLITYLDENGDPLISIRNDTMISKPGMAFSYDVDKDVSFWSSVKSLNIKTHIILPDFAPDPNIPWTTIKQGLFDWITQGATGTPAAPPTDHSQPDTPNP